MDTDPEVNQDLEKPSDASQKEGASAKDEQTEPLYIVGMGGSAGGLEAFEEFFKNSLLILDWHLCSCPISIRLIKD